MLRLSQRACFCCPVLCVSNGRAACASVRAKQSLLDPFYHGLIHSPSPVYQLVIKGSSNVNELSAHFWI